MPCLLRPLSALVFETTTTERYEHDKRHKQTRYCDDTRRGDEEEEEYDFEYSDEEEEDTDVHVDLENSYYSAKALKAEDPEAAVEAFREVKVATMTDNHKKSF